MQEKIREAFGLLNHNFSSRTLLLCHLKWLISGKLGQTGSIRCMEEIPSQKCIKCEKYCNCLSCCLVNCNLDGAFTTVMKDRSCFSPLMDRRKHTNKNVYNALLRPCQVRNWHKGQNRKASLVRFVYTDSGFCFQLMEWEIQACKSNSALRLSIHSPKKKKTEKKIILHLFSSTNIKYSTNVHTVVQAFVGFGAK